jgi:hypothetical protein
MRGRMAWLGTSISILLLWSGSCATRESTKQSSSGADSIPKIVTGSADSALGMSRSTPEWLNDSRVPEPVMTREKIMALGPMAIRLEDMGFSAPSALPDTTGLKNKAKVMREWAEALVDYKAGEYPSARDHLARARELAPLVKDPDPLWPFRFRNLDAGAIYSTQGAGEVRKVYGEIAEPDRENVFDVGYEWVMAMDDLRQGNGRNAVARLRLIGRSPHRISLEAKKILFLLLPGESMESSDA